MNISGDHFQNTSRPVSHGHNSRFSGIKRNINKFFVNTNNQRKNSQMEFTISFQFPKRC